MQRGKRLTDLLWFQEGPGIRNTQYTDSGVKLLNVANLAGGKVNLSTSGRYISEAEAYGKYRHFLADEGDLIVGASGIRVENFENKMGFVRREQLPLCMNTGTIRFKVLDENALDIRYFMYYLKSDAFKAQLAAQITGSAQLNFGPSHLKKMTMPVCSMERQRRIVTVLDKAAQIVEKLGRELAALDALAGARFAELFGDPEADGGKYPMANLEDLCTDIVDCPHTTPKSYTQDPSYPLIRTAQMKNGEIDWSGMHYVTEAEYKARTAKFVPEKGDIVYGREGSFGEAVLLPDSRRFCLGQRVVLLRADRERCYPEFLWSSLRSPYVYRQAKQKNFGATVAHVNIADIRKFRILLPGLEAQRVYVDWLNQLSEAKEKTRQMLCEIRCVRKSLMGEFF